MIQVSVLMSSVTWAKLCLSEHQFLKLKMGVIRNSISLVGCEKAQKMWVRYEGKDLAGSSVPSVRADAVKTLMGKGEEGWRMPLLTGMVHGGNSANSSELTAGHAQAQEARQPRPEARERDQDVTGSPFRAG